MLLAPSQLKKLDALALHARKAFTGASKGEKRSTKRGSSVEFADFRAYNAGDDIRRIDWNAYARFDKLFLKMFLEEEDLDLTLLIDASASMQFGEPPKIRAACPDRGRARLHWSGQLRPRERCDFWRIGFRETVARSISAVARQGRGRRSCFAFSKRRKPRGRADFAAATRRLSLQAKRSGLAMVVSDFLFAEGYEAGLKTLAARGFETTVVQSTFSRRTGTVDDWRFETRRR
jgi:hypothetical protein